MCTSRSLICKHVRPVYSHRQFITFYQTLRIIILFRIYKSGHWYTQVLICNCSVQVQSGLRLTLQICVAVEGGLCWTWYTPAPAATPPALSLLCRPAMPWAWLWLWGCVRARLRPRGAWPAYPPSRSKPSPPALHLSSLTRSFSLPRQWTHFYPPQMLHIIRYRSLV